MKTEFKVSKEFILMAYNEACEGLKSKLRAEFPEAFEPEFKAGDWVIGKKGIPNLAKKIIYLDGGTARYFDIECDMEKPCDKGSNNGQFVGELRLATPEEIKESLKFNVGVWVTTIGTTFHSEKNNGNTFKIGYVDTQSLFVCEEKKDEGYGVFNGEFRLATPEEILAHLSKEADKRGFKEGVTIDNSMLIRGVGRVKLTWGTFGYVYCDRRDCLRLGGDRVYKNGEWATIIPTEVEVSMEEIAKWKGCKINELKIK